MIEREREIGDQSPTLTVSATTINADLKMEHKSVSLLVEFLHPSRSFSLYGTSYGLFKDRERGIQLGR